MSNLCIKHGHKMITIYKASVLLNRAYSTVKHWYVRDGVDNLKALIIRAKGSPHLPGRKAKTQEYKSPVPRLPFNRGTHCYRDRFKEVCIHYNSCQEHRIYSGTHHERYRKDGSCYDGMDVQPVSQQRSSGQREIQRLDKTVR